MGGNGSGRRENLYSSKVEVEGCLSCDISRWLHWGFLSANAVRSGTLERRYTTTGDATDSVGYSVDLANAHVRLQYRKTGEDYDYHVNLISTRPHYGGLRWWFICPLMVDGRACQHRVRKLYLPPGGRYFGCRRCYQLDYRSQRKPADRALSKAQEIRVRLGGDASVE